MCEYAGYDKDWVCFNARKSYNCTGSLPAAVWDPGVVRCWLMRSCLAVIKGDCQPLVNETAQWTMTQTGFR